MNTTGKILLTVGLLGLTAGAVYAANLNQFKEELVVVPDVKLHKPIPLTIRIDVNFKNPTRTEMHILQPFCKVMYNGVVVGTSDVRDDITEIPALGEKKLKNPLMVQIPVLGMFSLAKGMYDDLMQGKPVQIVLETTCRYYAAGWRKYGPKQEAFTISKGVTA